MALRFVSASAQDRFIPLCYVLSSKGERQGEQRMETYTPRVYSCDWSKRDCSSSPLEEDR
jgi:hypothetical protein